MTYHVDEAVTKMARQIVSPKSIPTIVRDAFRVAEEERPGPVLLELPEDVAGYEAGAVPIVARHSIEWPVASAAAIDRAVAMIRKAKRPLIMIGAAGNRPRLVEGLSAFVQRTGIPFFNTQMGKGAVTACSDLYMGTAALSAGDYVHQAVDHADLIISIGHDTIEKPPFLMESDGLQVIHIGYTSANVEEVFFPQAEVLGDIGSSLTQLAGQLEGKLKIDPAFLALREEILGRVGEGSGDDVFRVIQRLSRRTPRRCRRMASSVRQLWYKLWFARNYRSQLRTLLRDKALAPMGARLPSAIWLQCFPEAPCARVCGDAVS